MVMVSSVLWVIDVILRYVLQERYFEVLRSSSISSFGARLSLL
jgi:hypothetical protein